MLDALQNGSVHDRSLCVVRATFCEEALARFDMPDVRAQFLQAHASAQWDLGNRKDAEREMQAIVDEDPDDAWANVSVVSEDAWREEAVAGSVGR